MLDRLAVGSHSFKHTEAILLEDLPELHTVTVGDQSFARATKLTVNDVPRVFVFTLGEKSMKTLQNVMCKSEWCRFG